VRKYLVLAVVPILLLVACKSSSDGSASPGSTTGGTAAVDTRAPGVTADTIKVGVTYVDLASIKDVTGVDHGDYNTAYTAEFDAINAAGGINGRKLEPVIVPVNPVGTDAADAACTKLTQDDPVFVTIGFFLNDGVLCYVDTNDTPVIGGSMSAERLAKAKAPWYTIEVGSDFTADVVRTLAEGGDLAGKVAVVSNPEDQAEVNDVLQPILADNGIEPVATAVIDAPVTDAAAQISAAQTIAERFKSAGADQVLVVGNAASAFGRGLARTDYRPQLVFTSVDAATTYANDQANDLSILDRSITGSLFGPKSARLALDNPASKECWDTQRNAGLTIVPPPVPKGEPEQFQSSATACLTVSLLKAILEKAGTDLNYGTFRAAGDSLGEVNLPTYPDGTWHFGAPPSADGDPTVYAFTWDAQAGDYLPANS